MDPLATSDDLDARGITSSFAQVDTYLAVASSVVREAAGSPISQKTSSITLEGYHGEKRIRLPGGPVTSVDSVTVDGETVNEGTGYNDYTVAGEFLWRSAGWGGSGGPERPARVEVTYTHGMAEVPEHIVDLVCSMVAAARAALEADEDGLELGMQNGRVQSVTIDGFSETYATSGEAIEAVTAMTLPKRTRDWLAQQFGQGASVGASR